MHVEITREPKLSRLDHLFVIVLEKGDLLQLGEPIRRIAEGVMKRSGFDGRADESITVLESEPRKITLVGAGKPDAFSIRALKTALTTVAKIAQKQRDQRIAVAVAASLPDHEAEAATRLTASLLAQADYTYDAFKTEKTKEEKQRKPIEALLIATPSINVKRLRIIESSARAISEGLQTVRDLGNGPPNVVTPTALADRAAEVARQVGVKCTVYGRREIERMKMGGLLAVNRGSAEDPRFVVLEYTPRRAKTHVALVGKGITFDSGGISI